MKYLRIIHLLWAAAEDSIITIHLLIGGLVLPIKNINRSTG
jgi:hypothetical protein